MLPPQRPGRAGFLRPDADWSKISGASLEIRQAQSKAILKLAGTADGFDLHKRIGGLNQHLRHAKSGMQL